MIDQNGFRENVGIVLVNSNRDVFWGRRAGTSFWQMPQGGIEKGETPKDAMLRELNEEVGLRPKHVEVIHRTNDWLHYRLPDSRVRISNGKKFIGQKQIWYLLKLVKSEDFIDINFFSEPEFDKWRWVNFWEPLKLVAQFKKTVYENALNTFYPFLEKEF